MLSQLVQRSVRLPLAAQTQFLHITHSSTTPPPHSTLIHTTTRKYTLPHATTTPLHTTLFVAHAILQIAKLYTTHYTLCVQKWSYIAYKHIRYINIRLLPDQKVSPFRAALIVSHDFVASSHDILIS